MSKDSPSLSPGHQDILSAAKTDAEKKAAYQHEVIGLNSAIISRRSNIEILQNRLLKPELSQEERTKAQDKITRLENDISDIQSKINEINTFLGQSE